MVQALGPGGVGTVQDDRHGLAPHDVSLVTPSPEHVLRLTDVQHAIVLAT